MKASRVFPSPPPRSILQLAESVNRIPDGSFEKLLKHAEDIVLGIQFFSEDRMKGIEKDLKVEEGGVLATLRLYSYLMRGFLRESSAEKFQEEVGSMGLEEGKPRLLWESFSSKRPEIESQMKPFFREQFGPILSEIHWRIDKPIAGSEPLGKEPVGIITFGLKGPDEDHSERFEVDLETLDRLMDELSNSVELSRTPSDLL